MTNPILEAKAQAWIECAEDAWQLNDSEMFDAGWEAALEMTAPIIEAAIATWRVIALGSDGMEVVGLGGAGLNALKAAENWLAVVKPDA